MNKLLIFILLVISLSSCKNDKKSDYNNEQDKSIPGDYFENQNAADLNEKGIEFSKNGDYKNGKEAFLKELDTNQNMM